MATIPLTLISTGSRGEQLNPSSDGLIDAAGFSFVARGDIPGSTASTTNSVYFAKDLATGRLTQSSPNEAHVTDVSHFGGGMISSTPLRSDDTNGTPDAYVPLTGSRTSPSTYTNISTGSNGSTYGVTEHGDGYVYTSTASNLVAGDTNGTSDIFYKRIYGGFGPIVRVSTDSNGNQANGASFGASESNFGPYVLFTSAASNLTSDGIAGGVFIKNLDTGATIRDSTTSTGAPVTASGGDLTFDGKLAVFASTASNVVSGDMNGVSDIFLKNIQTGQVTLVSSNSDGTQLGQASHDPQITPGGKFVIFQTDGNGMQIYAKNLETGTLTLVSADYATGAMSNGINVILNVNDDSLDFLSTAGGLLPGVNKGGIFTAFLDPSAYVGSTLLIQDTSFTLPDGSNNLTLGASASQTVTGNSLGNIITSNNYGSTINGAAGNDTVIIGRSADIVTGGAGDDTFTFKVLPWNAGHVTDFTIGSDKLDLTALLQASGYTGTDPVRDGYVVVQADGSGGTRLLYDTDGPGSGNTIQYNLTTLDNVSASGLGWAQLSGGGSPPPPPPPPPGNGITLTSSRYGDTLVGGLGDDTLIAGQGPDTLTGNGGADKFVYGKLPWNAGHLTDFTPGTDKLDLRGLFQAAGYTGSNPVADGTLKFVPGGGYDTKVYFNPHDPANPYDFMITTVDGVEPFRIGSGDWMFQ